MEDSLHFLLNLALILLLTKVFGLLSKKFQLPQVVGSLLAGIILGPVVLGFITETSFIHKIAELGVIILMFGAGLETNVEEMKKSGPAALLIALAGVLLPLGLGAVLVMVFPPESSASFLQAVFIGVILSATSVSITVETLKEMGKLSSKAGSVIMSAAILDDVIGIVALTLVTSVADTSVNIWLVLGKLVGFFVFAAIVGFLFYKGFSWWTKKEDRDLRRYVIISFVFALMMSYAADRFFGVADITGAYLAGLIISMTSKKEYVAKRFDTISYMLFTPVFFASIGIRITSLSLTWHMAIFALALILVAIIAKVVGCGLTAKLCHYDSKDALRIGVGMIARGEVALIVANKGVSLGIISQAIFTPVVLLIIVTSMVTPILLKLVFAQKKAEGALAPEQSSAD